MDIGLKPGFVLDQLRSPWKFVEKCIEMIDGPDQAEGKAGGMHKCLVGSTDGEAFAEERAVPVDTGDGKGLVLSLNPRCRRDRTLLSQTSILLQSWLSMLRTTNSPFIKINTPVATYP
jgi:hypothetical protein